ncbi:MAG: hypothetical protein AAFN93_20450 [Bacteroidota bacterium]
MCTIDGEVDEEEGNQKPDKGVTYEVLKRQVENFEVFGEFFQKEFDDLLINEDGKELKGWVLATMWLNNNSIRINPFSIYSELKQKESELKLQRMELNKANERYEDSLVVLSDKIALFNNLVGKECKDCLKPEVIQDYLEQVSVFGRAVIDIKRSKSKDSVSVSKINKEVNELKKKVDRLEKSYFKDVLLNNGVLFFSQKNYKIFMRHHDSKDDYLLMNPYPIQEIDEDERVELIIHNLREKIKLNLKLDIEPVEAQSKLEEQLLSSKSSGVAQTIAKSSLIIDSLSLSPEAFGITEVPSTQMGTLTFSQYLKSYLYYNNRYYLTYNLSQYGIPQLPLKKKRTDRANYFSDILPSKTIRKGPVLAKYEISTTKTDKNKEEESLIKGNYRINKRFKARFKAGLLYSFFNKESFTVENNVVSSSSEVFGVDGTVGIQVYINKHDIRSKRVATFLYTGLSLRNITENLYVGAGFEPFSGIGLLGGIHIAQTDVLENNNGVFEVKNNRWAGNLFLGVNIDVEVFRKLFGLKEINPF